MTLFFDASALVAILAREEDAGKLADTLDRHASAVTSPLAIFESAIAIARLKQSTHAEAQRDIADFLAEAEIGIVTISSRESDLALDAHERFGKGRHRAALNMGDCFSYACAKARRAALLCKGDDFVHTDIRLA